MNKPNVNLQTVDAIFHNEGKNFQYIIPKYQREYAWTKSHWSDLFDDILSNDIGYFLGSIICINENIDHRTEIETYEVIDGQQRITTISILLSCICNKIQQIKKNYFMHDDDLNDELTFIKKSLVTKEKNSENYIPRLIPQTQNYNQDDYNYLLFEKTGYINEIKKPKNFGRRKISKAYDFFEKQIDIYLKDEAPDCKYFPTMKHATDFLVYQKLIELKSKLTQSCIVSIDVHTASDAYVLFEALNKRGLPITSLDLIKNKLIQKADKDNCADKAANKWQKIIDYISDDGSIQERFFKHFYNAFIDELNNKFYPNSGENNRKYPLGNQATRAKFLQIYDDMVDKDWSFTLESLLLNAKIYGKLINNIPLDDGDEMNILQNALLDLEHAQAAPSYVFLLYIYCKKDELKLSLEDVKNIINLITIFFVRRSLTDVPATKYLDKMFAFDIKKHINGFNGKDLVIKIKEYLKTNTCSDEEFAKSISGQIYDENVDMTRFLLCYYEQTTQTREIYTDLWKREKDKYLWTIEHIFPEGNNIPQKWVDMIANGDKNLANRYLKEYTHKLGNLTITGYNSVLSNDDFITKRNKQKDGKYVGYKNGLSLNKEISQMDEWHIQDIENRTKKLVDWFKTRFNYY